MAMTELTIGYFGKLPSHRESLQQSVSGAFCQQWGEWLQRCMNASCAALAKRWDDVYLTSPVWRFFVSEGVIADSSFGGLVIPSVDRFGRYFPLTIVAELPAKLEPLTFAQTADRWLWELEDLALDAVQTDGLDLPEFERALAASVVHLSELNTERDPSRFAATATHWRCSIPSADALASPLATLPIDTARLALHPMSLWWTDGSQLVRPSALLVRTLPDPVAFTAMLAGTWAQAGWVGDIEQQDAQTSESKSVSVHSAAVTSTGTARMLNQDNFMCSNHHHLWAVADGVGGGLHGEIASKMVTDALIEIEPGPTLEAAMQTVHAALRDVNADLHAANTGYQHGVNTGSTVVALVVRGAQWTVAWAGDSRAYLYRDGDLTQLTTDHSLRNHPAMHGNGARADSALDGIITRAVGAEADLQLDEVSGGLRVGDRFLLCSDGVHHVLTPQAMALALAVSDPAMAAREVLAASLAAATSDDATAIVIDVRATE